MSAKAMVVILSVVGIAGLLAGFAARKPKQKPAPPPCDEHSVIASAPRAPMRGPSREALIKILQRPDVEDYLPITLAKYSPGAVVRKEGKRWVIRAMEEDSAAVKDAYEKAMANGNGFRDENTWPFRRPGRALVEALTKEEFIAAIAAMPWDFGEEDGRGEKPFLKHKKRRLNK